MKLNEIHLRDPFILNDNGKYYLYGTRGRECTGPFTGSDVFTSDDLENWSDAKEVFTPPEDFWGTEDCWAPEVHKYNGKYYMLVSFTSPLHCRGTQILMSDSPEGPFEPVSDKPLTPPDWECLDGTLYINKNNKPFLIFSHEWTQIQIGEMCAVPLSDDLSEPAGEPIILFKADEPSWSDGLDHKSGKIYVTDGPFMYRKADGQLVMIWSSFCNSQYVEAIAVSDNGEIDGNWIHSEKFLLGHDSGHGMLFRDNNGKLKLTLHSPNTLSKERPCIIDVDENSLSL